MIKLMIGPAGTGKTKALSEIANEDVKKTKGNLVYIDHGSTRKYNVDYKIRFINIADYSIKDKESFYGFICGVVASNYDVETIYIDGLYRITKTDIYNMKDLFHKLDILELKYNINFIITISADKENVPEFLNKYIKIE